MEFELGVLYVLCTFINLYEHEYNCITSQSASGCCEGKDMHTSSRYVGEPDPSVHKSKRHNRNTLHRVTYCMLYPTRAELEPRGYTLSGENVNCPSHSLFQPLQNHLVILPPSRQINAGVVAK
jgi:hypothetical protein